MPDSAGATPVYSSLEESSMNFTGGTITIEGSNLGSVSQILVGPENSPPGSATTTPSADGNSVAGTFPSQLATDLIGKQTVWVMIGGQQTSTGLKIDVAGPTIHSIKPTSGPVAGGTQVTIKGQLFDSTSTVGIGANGSLTDIAVTEETKPGGKTEKVLTGKTNPFPTDYAGTEQTVVLTYKGATVSPAEKFTVNGITLSGISPTQGSIGGGTSVTLTGSGFTTGATVTIGGVAVENISIQDSGTQITGTTKAFAPTQANQSLDVTVTDSNGTATLDNAFTIMPPTLSSISPKDKGLICGGEHVTLTGTHLTGAAEVTFTSQADPKKAASVDAGDFISHSDTGITLIVPAGQVLGAADVTATVQTVQSNAVTYTYTLADSVPVTIDINSAGLPSGTQVYAYVVGNVAKSGVATYYRFNAEGDPVEMDPSDNKVWGNQFPGYEDLSAKAITELAAKNYPKPDPSIPSGGGWADYSIPVPADGKLTIDLAKINSTNMPNLGTGLTAFSGRIYLSVGVPRLPFTVHASGGHTQPASMGGAGEYCLFDWIEFSFDSLQNLNANTTQVDGFGLPLNMDVEPRLPTSDITSVGLTAGTTRSAVYSALNPLFPSGEVKALDGCMDEGPTGITAFPSSIEIGGTAVLRTCSPDTISHHTSGTAGVAGFYDDTIDDWYTAWATTPLVTYDVQTGHYSAMVVTVSGVEQLQFKAGQHTTKTDWTNAGDVAFTFADKITTADIWQCDGMLATGDKASLNAGKIIAAAFNRGTVSNSLSDAGDSNAGFYPSGGTWNTWAQMTHTYGLHGLAYGFPYDDVAKQNPSIAFAMPKAVTINLGTF